MGHVISKKKILFILLCCLILTVGCVRNGADKKLSFASVSGRLYIEDNANDRYSEVFESWFFFAGEVNVKLGGTVFKDANLYAAGDLYCIESSTKIVILNKSYLKFVEAERAKKDLGHNPNIYESFVYHLLVRDKEDLNVYIKNKGFNYKTNNNGYGKNLREYIEILKVLHENSRLIFSKHTLGSKEINKLYNENNMVLLRNKVYVSSTDSFEDTEKLAFKQNLSALDGNTLLNSNLFELNKISLCEPSIFKFEFSNKNFVFLAENEYDNLFRFFLQGWGDEQVGGGRKFDISKFQTLNEFFGKPFFLQNQLMEVNYIKIIHIVYNKNRDKFIVTFLLCGDTFAAKLKLNGDKEFVLDRIERRDEYWKIKDRP